MSSPQRYPTRDELDYLERQKAGFPGLGIPANQSRGEVTALQTQFAVEGNDTTAYVGVTSDRMTYANDTEQPLAADGSAEEDAEVAREERLLQSEVLVTPRPPVPESNQTGGGGSTQESVYTAMSGENFSSEIAKEPTTEKVEVPTADGGTGELEVGKFEGSTGEKVQDAEAENTTVAASGGVAPSSLSGEAPDEESAPSTPPATPRPAKKASSTSTNAT